MKSILGFWSSSRANQTMHWSRCCCVNLIPTVFHSITKRRKLNMQNESIKSAFINVGQHFVYQIICWYLSVVVNTTSSELFFAYNNSKVSISIPHIFANKTKYSTLKLLPLPKSLGRNLLTRFHHFELGFIIINAWLGHIYNHSHHVDFLFVLSFL